MKHGNAGRISSIVWEQGEGLERDKGHFIQN
jgi:hypothetical protein